MHKLTALLIAGTTLAWSGAALADPGSRQTREYVQAAGQSDAFEILEGYTVLTGSSDPQIKAFAQQMIRDHTQTSQALTAATTQSGLTPPPKGMSDDEAHMLGTLQSLRGHDFDVAYLKQQKLAHTSALVTTQKYASAGDDQAVKHAAMAAAPIITMHLTMVEQMQARLGGS